MTERPAERETGDGQSQEAETDTPAAENVLEPETPEKEILDEQPAGTETPAVETPDGNTGAETPVKLPDADTDHE